MDTIDRSSSTISFIERIPFVQRIVLFLFSLLPLAAPYELILVPSRESGTPILALIPVVISLGAVAIGLVLVAAALIGAEQHITFDSGMRTIVHRSMRGLAGRREQRYPFGTVVRVELRTHEWSDGPASHNIVVYIDRGPELEFGRFGSKEDAERERELLEKSIGLPH